MPFVTTTQVRLSDLIVHEIDPSVGANRRDMNITPAGEVTLGTVVFRAKSPDQTAPFAVLTDAAALVDTNEFAIVIGDHFGYNAKFTPRAIAASMYNAVGIVGNGNAIQLKELFVKQYVLGKGLTEANYQTLRGLLEQAGIQLLRTV